MFKRRRRSERDFAEEIAAHLELEADELKGEGVSDDDAMRRARATFYNPGLVEERYRMRYRVEWFDTLMRDLRFAFRQLRRSPGFAATAILTLAIGLGANTAIFSLVDALLLRPLDVPDADRLAVLSIDRTDNRGPQYGFNAPEFRAIERRHEVFERIAASNGTRVPVMGSSGNQELPVMLVSGQYFEMLETAPLLGRYLLPTDDVVGARTVVISEGFWRSWFNGAPDVVNRKLVIANTPFTVVGVMTGRFRGTDPARRPAIYLPLSAEPVVDDPFNLIKAGFHANWITLLGRLRSGMTLEQANTALAPETIPIVEEAGADAAWIKGAEAGHMRFRVESGATGFTYFRMMFQKPLMVVLGLCGAVLLLACLNLTSLLTARAAARERELATRLAIGATRRRLVQQLLVESFLVTAIGTAVGLLATPAISHALAGMLLNRAPDAYVDTGINLRLFVFAAGVTSVTALVVGLLPALRATSRELHEQIKNGSHTRTSGNRRQLLPRVLLGSEVALALMLVIGAGLLAASLTRLYRTGLGFDAKGLVSLNLDTGKEPIEGDALLRWYQEFGDALRRVPGVKSVSFAGITPLSDSTSTDAFKSSASDGERQVCVNEVSPEYFATMRIPVIAGREYLWTDTAASGKKVILNEAAARLLFPGRNAVGQMVTGFGGKEHEVIAVVGDAKYASIQKAAPPTAYRGITQQNNLKGWSWTGVIRYEGDAGTLAATARGIVSKMAPEIPPPVLTTMSRQIDISLTMERMMAMLSLFFAGCALLVTGIGLYGTLAYATARRTSEIGIRMALGAQRLQVVLMVFRENAWSTAVGALAGLGIAMAGARVLASFLYGTSVHDPWVLVGAVLALGLIACVASLLPAVRAARIDPMRALRAE